MRSIRMCIGNTSSLYWLAGSYFVLYLLADIIVCRLFHPILLYVEKFSHNNAATRAVLSVSDNHIWIVLSSKCYREILPLFALSNSRSEYVGLYHCHSKFSDFLYLFVVTRDLDIFVNSFLENFIRVGNDIYYILVSLDLNNKSLIYLFQSWN